MMIDHPREGQPWHSDNCRGCDVCRPPAPCDSELTPVDTIWRVASVAFAVGLVLAWLLGRAGIGGGIGVMFQ